MTDKITVTLERKNVVFSYTRVAADVLDAATACSVLTEVAAAIILSFAVDNTDRAKAENIMTAFRVPSDG